MKMKEELPMKEVHKIRLKMHKETRGMSTEEYLRYINEKASLVIKELGITLKTRK